MTKRLVEYTLEDGSTVIAEVDVSDSDAEVMPVGSADDTIIRAGQTFEAALANIKPAVIAVYNQLQGLSADEVAVTFGVKLNVAAGAIIASAGIDAHYTVTLKWAASKSTNPK